jgi:hypothetical protein
MAAIREHVIKQKKEGEKLKLSMRNFEAALNKIKTRTSSINNSSKTMYRTSFPESGALV